MAEDPRILSRARLRDERGGLPASPASSFRVALGYPSPYAAAMSSLGVQVIYRELATHPGVRVERTFLPDDPAAHRATRTPLYTIESEAPAGGFDLLAFSVAYELEVAGLIECLDLAGLPVLASERSDRHPLILAGGPLTFSNPVPLGPFVDAVLLGEAEQIVHGALDAVMGASSRAAALDALEAVPSCWIPSRHGERLPPIAAAPDDRLPAHSVFLTPHAELSSMALVETERGCSRGCTYCVMRRSTNGGMRLATVPAILARVPAEARKVGLVGAAVSDHPQIVEIVSTLADQGRAVSLSSLRADRLDDAFVAALARAGGRSLTTAADGASERLRLWLKRGGKTAHLERAAELCRAHGLERLKLYGMVGLPGETDDDIDELVGLVTALSRRCRVSLSVAPFVSKRNTPLDALPFAGIAPVEARLRRLRAGLRGRADVRPVSPKWAWVEWVLAQGGQAEGLAVHAAWQAGGRFAAYRAAFRALPARSSARLPVVSARGVDVA